MKTILNTALFTAILVLATSCKPRRLELQSAAMEPTIPQGAVVDVDYSAYDTGTPSRWDVVVFASPFDEQSQWCFRVVGLPGEIIDIGDTGLTIDGKPTVIPARLSFLVYEAPHMGLVLPDGRMSITLPYRIPEDSYFVLGDNVGNSLDSRYWGAVSKDEILGKIPGK